MHGGHLVKELRLNQLHTWLKEFCANNHCECAAHNKHSKAEPEVQCADIFMVGGEYPPAYIFSPAISQSCGTMCHIKYSLLALFVIENINWLSYVANIVAPCVALVVHDRGNINF